MMKDRSPGALGRADVRRCGTLWAAEPATGEYMGTVLDARFRVVSERDMEPLRRAMAAAGADNPELARVRLLANRLGYLAEPISSGKEGQAGGIVLAYGWIARAGDSINDLGFDLDLPPDEVWIYDCATVPAARGQGLYTALLHTMRHDFPAYGVRHGWIGTEPRNWASQRGIARAGFVKVADMDWTGGASILYGVPGVSPSLVRFAAAALSDGPETRVLPDAGIPVIEAELLPVEDGGEDQLPTDLLRFQATYGNQIHWRRVSRSGAYDAGNLTLRSQGREMTLAYTTPFDELVHVLDGIAPNIPWLDTESLGSR